MTLMIMIILLKILGFSKVTEFLEVVFITFITESFFEKN